LVKTNAVRHEKVEDADLIAKLRLEIARAKRENGKLEEQLRRMEKLNYNSLLPDKRKDHITMEGESHFQSINDALQSILPDIIPPPTAHQNTISVIAEGTPAYCIHQIFTKALPESLLEIYLRDFKLALYRGSHLYDESLLASNLQAHYRREEWINFWSRRKSKYTKKLRQAQSIQSSASSAGATTCKQHISGKENNIMEGSRQGTTQGDRMHADDIIDLTLADDE
jgi:hypothetical protein